MGTENSPIEFGAGTLYFSKPDDSFEELGKVTEMDVESVEQEIASMNIVIVEVPVRCSICGKEYIANCINGHITYPHICSDCIKEILKEEINK